METVLLSGTEQPISRIGFGGCPTGGHDWGAVDDAESVAAIHRAVELGINFFDTADVYGLGHSEEVLANALGQRRHEMVIASKFGMRWDESRRPWKDTSPGYLRKALEGSLRRLRLDCIPLYYIHWPDDVTPIPETMAELLRCRDEGKIRWIGVSNFRPAQLREALSVAKIQAVQVQMSLLDRQEATALLPIIHEAGLTMATWGSLSQGLLTGKFDARTHFETADRRRRYENFIGPRFEKNLRLVEVVKEVAQRLGRTSAQVAIRWLLDTCGVGTVLCGAKRSSQVEDNAGAIGWRLPKDDYQALTDLLHESPP